MFPFGTSLASLSAGVTVVVLWSTISAVPPAAAQMDAETVPQAWQTVLEGRNLDCWLLAPSGDDTGSPFAGTQCAESGLKLHHASEVVQTEQGDLKVLDDSGKPIAVFATADGAGYEVIQPSSRLIALVASSD